MIRSMFLPKPQIRIPYIYWNRQVVSAYKTNIIIIKKMDELGKSINNYAIKFQQGFQKFALIDFKHKHVRNT